MCLLLRNIYHASLYVIRFVWTEGSRWISMKFSELTAQITRPGLTVQSDGVVFRISARWWWRLCRHLPVVCTLLSNSLCLSTLSTASCTCRSRKKSFIFYQKFRDFSINLSAPRKLYGSREKWAIGYTYSTLKFEEKKHGILFQSPK